MFWEACLTSQRQYVQVFKLHYLKDGSALPRLGPSRYGTRQLCEDISVTPPRTLQHMEGVVGSIYHMQGGAMAQLGTDRAQEREVSQGVSRTLQKEHRHRHSLEVSGAFGARTARLMQWKANEHRYII